MRTLCLKGIISAWRLFVTIKEIFEKHAQYFADCVSKTPLLLCPALRTGCNYIDNRDRENDKAIALINFNCLFVIDSAV